MNSEPLLSCAEVAHRLGISSENLRLLVHANIGPRAIRVGRRTLKFDSAEVNRWIASRTIGGAVTPDLIGDEHNAGASA